MSLELRVGRKYRLGRKFNSGSFGDLYLGSNVQTGEEVAVKLEPMRSQYPQLVRESKVYKAMAKEVGIPRMKWCGVAQDYNALVLDLLGSSLEEHFQGCSRRFSLKTVLVLADQLLTRVERLHTKGYIHRDIKPDNFLMGRMGSPGQDIVHMIDFGLSKLYCHPNNRKHIAYCEGKKLTGTVRYASINAHMGRELSRRDDLESLGYCLIYFLAGRLPWQGMKATSKHKYEHIMEKKMGTAPEILCRGLPVEFCSFLKYARSLKFDETPDYSYLRSLFKGLSFKAGYSFDRQFDWDVGSRQESNRQQQQQHQQQQQPEQRSDPMQQSRQQSGRQQLQQPLQLLQQQSDNRQQPVYKSSRQQQHLRSGRLHRKVTTSAAPALRRSTQGLGGAAARGGANKKTSEQVVKLPNIFFGLRNNGVVKSSGIV